MFLHSFFQRLTGYCQLIFFLTQRRNFNFLIPLMSLIPLIPLIYLSFFYPRAKTQRRNYILLSTNSDRSYTITSSCLSAVFTPSLSIVRQNGQLDTIVFTPVPKASSTRSLLIRLSPGSSSLNIWAPPAPQHKPLFLERDISFNSIFNCPNTSRGTSYIPLTRPR